MAKENDGKKLYKNLTSPYVNISLANVLKVRHNKIK